MNLHEIKTTEKLLEGLNYIYENLNWINEGDKAIHNKLACDKDTTLINWLNCNNKVLKYYGEYIDEMEKHNDKIKILIISEAPKLTINVDGNFICKYILGEGNPGSYRTVPFESIWEFKKGTSLKPKDYNSKSDAIKKLFIENNVAFIDLIPFPLPTIPTNLRKKWRERLEPNFILSLFIQAINHFTSKTKRVFDENLKIVFMLPTTTAYGIIEYCIKKNGSKNEYDFINKYREQMIRCNDNTIFSNEEMYNYSINLHRQIVICGSGGPVKNLFLNALKESEKI